MLSALSIVVALIAVYTVRHYCFTLNRLFGRQRHPYIDIDTADWPQITVLIPAHNEEVVIEYCISALLQVNYPAGKLIIMPVNDRSTDNTRKVIDEFARRYPAQVQPFHRESGKGGKAAALKDAMALVKTEIVLIFDADYIPGRGLVRQLVAPFFDPEVGGSMGRVVPLNVGSNLLTRLLDLERSGGYQVDQQARMNLRLVPQHGGTVGGFRISALNAVGGWNADTLTEDTDLTYRLLLGGWKTVDQNRSECYEEVPETWAVRIRQIMRWARGHNQAMVEHSLPLLARSHATFRERLDGLLLLGVFAMAPVLFLGWMLALAVFYLGEAPLHGVVAMLSLVAYSAMGNLAAFFEIAASVRLDHSRQRVRLLPLNLLGFLVSLVSITRAAFLPLRDRLLRREQHWDKTQRFRRAQAS